MRSIVGLALVTLMLSACATASAADPKPNIGKAEMVETVTAVNSRAQQLDALLKKQIKPEDYFDTAFLNAIPPAEFTAIIEGIIVQHGKPLHLVSVAPRGQYGATIQYAFERATATVELDVTAGEKNGVIGLLFAGFQIPDDDLAKIGNEIKALPGRTGFLVAALDEGDNAHVLASHNRDQQFAIGSTFKLYILAELAAQAKAGARKWSEVAPLNRRSFSSAGTGAWPKDAPMTLHTLASFMIALSDNSATDSLLFALGREAVEKRLASIGHTMPDKTLPFLSTVEAFALKANPALRDRFLKASEAQQRGLLESEAAALTLDKIDNAQLSKGPASIDSIEWFASPNDLLWLLNHIRAQNNDEMLSIMAINPGLPKASTARWQYAGYKGGSEIGVVSMSYLLQSKQGKWFVVTGSWNDAANAVDNTKFAALMERMVSAIAN